MFHRGAGAGEVRPAGGEHDGHGKPVSMAHRVHEPQPSPKFFMGRRIIDTLQQGLGWAFQSSAGKIREEREISTDTAYLLRPQDGG